MADTTARHARTVALFAAATTSAAAAIFLLAPRLAWHPGGSVPFASWFDLLMIVAPAVPGFFLGSIPPRPNYLPWGGALLGAAGWFTTYVVIASAPVVGLPGWVGLGPFIVTAFYSGLLPVIFVAVHLVSHRLAA